MIEGVGVDIIEVDRLEKAITNSDRFLLRVFTPAEIEYCGTGKVRFERFAARFAVKEAVSKALGITWGDAVPWTDAEVEIEESGKPLVRLSGKAAERVEALGVIGVHVSISHSGGLAVAMAVAEI